MNSETLRSSPLHRYYRTPRGAAVSCAIQHQAEYDPDDGQQPGYYGWCGYAEEQSDYVIGPFKTPDKVFAAYERRNPGDKPVESVTLYRDRAPTFTTARKKRLAKKPLVLRSARSKEIH